MDCLFLDLSPYYTDPIEEEFEVFLEESYRFIPSISNIKGWERRIADDEAYQLSRIRPRGSKGKFAKQ